MSILFALPYWYLGATSLLPTRCRMQCCCMCKCCRMLRSCSGEHLIWSLHSMQYIAHFLYTPGTPLHNILHVYHRCYHSISRVYEKYLVLQLLILLQIFSLPILGECVFQLIILLLPILNCKIFSSYNLNINVIPIEKIRKTMPSTCILVKLYLTKTDNFPNIPRLNTFKSQLGESECHFKRYRNLSFSPNEPNIDNLVEINTSTPSRAKISILWTRHNKRNSKQKDSLSQLSNC